MATLHSPQYSALARTFAAAFSALGDFAKRSPSEGALLWQAIASQVRSAEPMALLNAQVGAAPVLATDPASSIERHIEADASYKLTATRDADGRYVSLLLRDEDDTACGVMNPAQARILIEDIGRMLATVEKS